jgi:transcription-repair coupling factor (superfamily II helicase)
MNGKQTALLAPTTVLAQQHYETFLARFEGTPIRIVIRQKGDKE